MKKLIIIFFVLFSVIGCTDKPNIITRNIYVMDTVVTVKIYSNDIKANDAMNKVEELYNTYHKLTDRYNAYDNIVNIYYINNTLKINENIKIDNQLYNLLEYGINFNKEYSKVNIAVGNLVDIWKKYRDNNSGIPSASELSNIGSISINDIEISNSSIMKKSDVKLDLGCIAKGYATQKAGELLESLGFSEYVILAGGNVKVGNHYNNSKYNIGVQDPINPNNIYKTVKVNNLSIVTSGGYERFYRWNNEEYSHIIDPDTLYPSKYMRSVTVITKNSAYADLFSTYLYMIPIEEGIKYVNDNEDIEAVWYSFDNQIYTSKGFSAYE